jgi:hypothetical protein
MRERNATREATPRSRANEARNFAGFRCLGCRVDRCQQVEDVGTYRAGSLIDRLSSRFVRMAARGVAL